jgi:chromosome segregation ATPase
LKQIDLKKMSAVDRIVNELLEASFPENSSALETLVETMGDIAEAVAKWNGYGPWKKALSVSFKEGTTNASKYKARFEALFALLDMSMEALLRQVSVKSFARITDIQRQATSEAAETRAAFSDAARAQGLVLDDMTTLKQQLQDLKEDLQNIERSLAQVEEKVDDVSEKIDDVMTEIGKVSLLLVR